MERFLFSRFIFCKLTRGSLRGVDRNLRRNFSTSKVSCMKVCVAGGSGGIGQPLCLLLKLSPMVTELRIYDIQHTPGVAADLSHMETPAKVIGFHGVSTIKDAFRGSDIIMIPAGIPRKPGMSRDDLFTSNASVVRDISKVIAEVSPEACIGIVTNPVNACVPLCAKILETAGKLNPNKIFGISTLDIVRSNTFVAELKGLNPMDVKVPVIGGHAGDTIIPLISQASPKVEFPQDVLEKLVKKIQTAGDAVVKAKAGAGSCTLSMAYAAARFTLALIRGMKGEANVIECSYVLSNVTKAKFFSTPLLLGKNGIEKNLGIPKGISKYEQDMVDKAIGTLQKNIEQGEKFAQT